MPPPFPSLYQRVLAQLGTYNRPVDARTIAAGMAGTVHPQDVHTQLQALELDAMATADGSRKLYVITEEGKQLLWDLRR